MKGAVRPCENPTINIAILLSDYALAQGMCLYLLRSGFSLGLHRAKTTEVRAKEGLRRAKITEAAAVLVPPRYRWKMELYSDKMVFTLGS